MIFTAPRSCEFPEEHRPPRKKPGTVESTAAPAGTSTNTTTAHNIVAARPAACPNSATVRPLPVPEKSASLPPAHIAESAASSASAARRRSAAIRAAAADTHPKPRIPAPPPRSCVVSRSVPRPESAAPDAPTRSAPSPKPGAKKLPTAKYAAAAPRAPQTKDTATATPEIILRRASAAHPPTRRNTQRFLPPEFQSIPTAVPRSTPPASNSARQKENARTGLVRKHPNPSEKYAPAARRQKDAPGPE